MPTANEASQKTDEGSFEKEWQGCSQNSRRQNFSKLAETVGGSGIDEARFIDKSRHDDGMALGAVGVENCEQTRELSSYRRHNLNTPARQRHYVFWFLFSAH